MPHISEAYNKIGKLILSNRSNAKVTGTPPQILSVDLSLKIAFSACEARFCVAADQHNLSGSNSSGFCEQTNAPWGFVRFVVTSVTTLLESQRMRIDVRIHSTLS